MAKPESVVRSDRAPTGAASTMECTQRGMKVTAAMLRLRFDDARRQAVKEALECQDTTLAESVRQFQFRDIRPKAASEIHDLGDASRLLGHTDKRITETVHRRVGEIVEPTR